MGIDLFCYNGKDYLLISLRYSEYGELNDTTAETWDLDHRTLLPGYPQSNGMKKAEKSKEDKHLALNVYLPTNMPIDNQGQSPAQMLTYRRLRDGLIWEKTKLRPLVQRKRNWKKQGQEPRKEKNFQKRRSNMVSEEKLKNRRMDKRKICEKNKNPRSYWVKNEKGKIYRQTSWEIKQRKMKKIQEEKKKQKEESKNIQFSDTHLTIAIRRSTPRNSQRNWQIYRKD
uniref:Uncharacterized protein n=1 Tax=Callorhinchus milii TaxID=7868 RepID=A0A4W3I3E8_CALMI